MLMKARPLYVSESVFLSTATFCWCFIYFKFFGFFSSFWFVQKSFVVQTKTLFVCKFPFCLQKYSWVTTVFSLHPGCTRGQKEKYNKNLCGAFFLFVFFNVCPETKINTGFSLGVCVCACWTIVGKSQTECVWFFPPSGRIAVPGYCLPQYLYNQ